MASLRDLGIYDQNFTSKSLSDLPTLKSLLDLETIDGMFKTETVDISHTYRNILEVSQNLRHL